jgi:hypothetical protein
MTGLRIFRVQSSSSSTIFGVPLAIASVGRNSSRCAAHLGARSTASCGDTAVLAGYSASSWARQWVLHDAGNDASGKQLVYVQNQVCVGLVAQAAMGETMGQGHKLLLAQPAHRAPYSTH